MTRRFPSVMANKLISWATGVPLHDYGCSLKVFRTEVVKPLRLYGEMHRFIPAIASQNGVQIAEMVVNHRPRQAGATKYGLSRTIRVILDLATVKFLLSYSTRPLQIFGLIGILTGGLGVLITGYLGYIRLFTTQGIGDRPLLLLGAMLIFIGVQLVTFGLLAEVMARTYYESQDKPTYVIREVRETADLEVLAAAASAERTQSIVGDDGGRPPREHDPRITVIQQELFDESRSKGDKYRELFVGKPGLGALLAYEAAMILASWVPGALGLVLRSRMYPWILGSVGRNVVFGVNVTLRHPHKIHIGDNVVIDDLCCLDAKGTNNTGITIGTGVFIGRNTILSCKNGDIVIDDRANIGFNCEVFSASKVRVGKDILMAAYTYLVGGDHLYDRTDIPVLQQGRTARGIEVGDGTWLGTHVVVTDGSTIGRDAIIGAGAVVVGEIPEFSIATGIPAKVTRDRRDPCSGSRDCRCAESLGSSSRT